MHIVPQISLLFTMTASQLSTDGFGFLSRAISEKPSLQGLAEVACCACRTLPPCKPRSNANRSERSACYLQVRQQHEPLPRQCALTQAY